MSTHANANTARQSWHEFIQLRRRIEALPPAAVAAAPAAQREAWQAACETIDRARRDGLGFAWLIPLVRVLAYAVAAGSALYVASKAKGVVDAGAAGAASAARWVPWVATGGLAWWFYNAGKRPRRRRSSRKVKAA